SAYGIAIGHLSGFENALDVALRVIADSGRRDVGNPSVPAFRIRTAGEPLADDDAAEGVAGAVALGAVTGAVDQIGATIFLRRFGGIRLELPAVEIKEFPASEQAADFEIERQVVVARLALDRRQRLEIGEEIAHVFHLHALVRRIGKSRIVVAAVGRGALPHGGEEIRLAPVAEAVLAVGRDVRGEKCAERRFEREAAAEPRLVLLL